MKQGPKKVILSPFMEPVAMESMETIVSESFGNHVVQELVSQRTGFEMN